MVFACAPCFRGVLADLQAVLPSRKSPAATPKRARRLLPRPSFRGRGRRFVSERPADLERVEDYYIIGDFLGSGSFGTVRRARSLRTGQACVVKAIRKERPELFKFVANELAVLSYCDHPSIVRVYDIFETEDEVHCAMQGCEGGNLEQVLAGQTCFSEDEGRLVMQQILRGVHYLHSVAGVVHRDLKLPNILLRCAGVPIVENQAKIIDFGFARSLRPGSNTLHELCGSPGYLAPEVVRLGRFDEKCDIFSCGIMLYRLLTSEYPFDLDVECLSVSSFSSPSFYERNICFRELESLDASGDGMHLVTLLCELDPAQRISAREALANPWFDDLNTQDAAIFKKTCKLGRSIQKQLSIEQSSCEKLLCLQQEILQLVAYRLDERDVDQERSLFQAMDSDGDGALTQEECLEMFQTELFGFRQDECHEIFQKLNINGSGQIGYTEFLSRAVQMRGRATSCRKAVYAAFTAFDKNNDGKISVEELLDTLTEQSVSSCRITLDDCHDTMRRVDSNGDGCMDFDEFLLVLGSEFYTH